MIKAILLACIRAYQLVISPWTLPSARSSCIPTGASRRSSPGFTRRMVEAGHEVRVKLYMEAKTLPDASCAVTRSMSAVMIRSTTTGDLKTFSSDVSQIVVPKPWRRLCYLVSVEVWTPNGKSEGPTSEDARASGPTSSP